MYDVVIVGAGMAGTSAAIWGQRLGMSIALFESAAAVGGQLHRVHEEIPDYPALLPCTGTDLAQILQAQTAALGITPKVHSQVVAIHGARREVALSDGEVIAGRAILLCTGAAQRHLGVDGEQESLSRRILFHSAPQDAWRLRGRHAAVVGGADSAVECARILLENDARKVTLIHRGPQLTARSDLLAGLEPLMGRVNVRTSSTVAWLRPGAKAGVTLGLGVGAEPVDVDGVFVQCGYAPSSELVDDIVERDALGYVVVDSNQCSSSPGIYAAGDVCKPGRPTLTAAAHQAETAIRHIRGLPN